MCSAAALVWLAGACSEETPSKTPGPGMVIGPVGTAGSAGLGAAGLGNAGSTAVGTAGLPAMPTAGASGAAAGAAGSMVMPPVAGAAGNPMAGASGSMSGTAGMAGGAAGMGMAGMAGMAGMPPAAGNTPPPPAGDWGTADPAMKGSFATTVENNVGPGMAFTMFRPMMLTKKHPVITWGNGTGTMPRTYTTMLTHYASHGFVVIASNSTNVAQGNPPPMVQGVTWVFEQNDNPMSPLYQKIDKDQVGATGHSQGAFATSSAAANMNIRVWAPLQGARAVTGQHGPGLLVCGTMDTTVPCSGASSAFDRINNLPVMYAELKAASHTNWIAGGFGGGAAHPYTVATTGWFRLHLMGDTALKPMFHGPMCKLCTDSAWVIKQKMLD